MKLLELRRLNLLLGAKLVLAYVAEKLFKSEWVKNQKGLIAYFNYLSRLDLYHRNERKNYYEVHSPTYGNYLLRKPDSSDYKVYQQVFLDEEYKPLIELVRLYCKKKEITVLDGGANIGFTTIYLNHHLKKEKKIHSILVEPFENNTDSALLNLELQDVKNFHIEIAGLYNKDCFLKIDQHFRDGLEWSVQILESDEPTSLRSLQIQQILEKYSIEELDVLKLDIEGAEKYLFADEDYAFSFLKKVRLIAIELHDEYEIRDRILSMLKKSGFRVNVSGELYIGVKELYPSAN